MACKESICRNCFHSYVCEQFNENKDDNNEKCHFANDHYVPRADVVPKREVDELRKKLDKTEVELMNVCLDKTNCDDMIQYILDFYFKRKVAEVFAEIEFEINQLDYDRDETRSIAIEGIIANAKKKYTGG